MSRRRARLLGAAAAALTIVGAAGCGADAEPQGSGTQTAPAAARPATTPQTTDTAPQAPPKAADAVAKLKPPLGFHVRHRAQLRARPGGRMVATIKTKTEFKSPTILAVAGRRPGWVLVRTAVRKHHVGWLPTSAGVFFSEPRSIVIDLSRRRLAVFHRGRLSDTFKVAIGTPATPTPRGRFAVTDRLTTGNPQGDYGCCILALNGRQSRIAQGWGGGDRVAIHATPHTWTIGKRISHGCVRGTNKALRRLMRQVRLGTPVTIHA